LMLSMLQQVGGGQHGARAFELEVLRESRPAARFDIPESDVVFVADRMQLAEVTVIVPLYNYAHYIEETLDSVREQSLPLLDLIVIDDRSTDASLELAIAWARRHAARFNRIAVMQNRNNAGLARTRNVGFDAAETAFVLPLDADNRLRPGCCAELLDALHASGAGFAYPRIQSFGGSDYVLGSERYAPMRFAGSNYIDAMTMVGKWAWAAVGGFVHSQYGWEDYEFWCRCAEFGIRGRQVDEILAEYRFHQTSMLRTVTDLTENKMRLIRGLEARHRWLTISRRPEGQADASSAADIS
ncbi:MAG: glycosyltransferase family 2 protein, partial [Gammaproteobacteria bacterium]